MLFRKESAMGNQPIHVFNEIGKLRKVILHRPGKELNNLMPDYLERLLFDDIPFLEEAQKEHDYFAQVLREEGVEVVYLEDLVSEAIDAANVKEQFIDEWLDESGIVSETLRAQVRQDLLSKSTYDMILKTMEGYRKNEIDMSHHDSLADLIESDYPLLVDPMPSLYFTRDPFALLGHGVAINHMHEVTRNRETIYGDYIFRYHPAYANQVRRYYYRDDETDIEGGDILVLSPEVVAVGISQRTDSRSIELLARRLFEQGQFKQVLAFLIGENRKFMHLDTVFTMVDYDKFTIHPEINAGLRVVSIVDAGDGSVIIDEQDSTQLDNVLAKALRLEKVTLISCGGGDIVDAAREQWNDGSNTLAIAPGVVVVYDRNTITNQLLEDHGIRLVKIKGSELVRGRGGPRCMSMPLIRDDI